MKALMTAIVAVLIGTGAARAETNAVDVVDLTRAVNESTNAFTLVQTGNTVEGQPKLVVKRGGDTVGFMYNPLKPTHWGRNWKRYSASLATAGIGYLGYAYSEDEWPFSGSNDSGGGGSTPVQAQGGSAQIAEINMNEVYAPVNIIIQIGSNDENEPMNQGSNDENQYGE